MSSTQNNAPQPTWRLLLAHPWGRVALAGFAGAILLVVAMGIGLSRGRGGSGGPTNTGELPAAPDPAVVEALSIAPEAVAVPESAPVAEIPDPAVESAPVAPPTPPATQEEPTAAEEVPVVAPDHVVVEVTEDGQIVPGAIMTQAELLIEIKRLHEKFDQLQETFNLVVTQMVKDVELENEQLRAEVQRLQARDQAGLLASAAVPRPAGELLNSLAEMARGMTEEELAEEEAPQAPAEFAFNVIEEWGRDPDAVAQLGGNAPTLKGVVGTVPRGSAREDIEALGRELRAQYATYDNINIEIFDDPVAAQTYADSQTMDAERRVLSISKYAATDRDAMTYYENGESMELPAQAPEVDESEDTLPLPDLGAAPVVEEAPAEEAPKPEEEASAPKRGRRSGR